MPSASKIFAAAIPSHVPANLIRTRLLSIPISNVRRLCRSTLGSQTIRVSVYLARSLHTNSIASFFFFSLSCFLLPVQPENTRKAERNTSFESSSDTNNVHEFGDEEGQITTNTNHKNKDQEQEENNCRNGSTHSERDSSDKVELFAEAMETVEAESGSFGNDDDQNNKPWKEFVDTVDVKTIPNLEAYLRARAIRTESSLRFSNAIDDCIQTFRDTTNEILSEVVAPVCNRYTESFDDTEESIIKTMVSNHSRRNKLLQLMDDADAAWSNKYNELTSEILIVVRNTIRKNIGTELAFFAFVLCFVPSYCCVLSLSESSRP